NALEQLVHFKIRATGRHRQSEHRRVVRERAGKADRWIALTGAHEFFNCTRSEQAIGVEEEKVGRPRALSGEIAGSRKPRGTLILQQLNSRETSADLLERQRRLPRGTIIDNEDRPQERGIGAAEQFLEALFYPPDCIFDWDDYVAARAHRAASSMVLRPDFTSADSTANEPMQPQSLCAITWLASATLDSG